MTPSSENSAVVLLLTTCTVTAAVVGARLSNSSRRTMSNGFEGVPLTTVCVAVVNAIFTVVDGVTVIGWLICG